MKFNLEHLSKPEVKIVTVEFVSTHYVQFTDGVSYNRVPLFPEAAVGQRWLIISEMDTVFGFGIVSDAHLLSL